MAALEEGLLAALMRDGCGLLEAFFRQHVPECAGQRRPGERHYRHRHLQVHSVLGRFSLCRVLISGCHFSLLFDSWF